MSNITNQEIIDAHLASGEELQPDQFPPTRHAFRCLSVSIPAHRQEPAPPEVVFVPRAGTARLDLVGVLASWNHLWEASQFRGELFNEERYDESVPSVVSWIRRLPPGNIYLVADTETKYDAYAPLYHLLPRRLLERYGLPLFKRPLWPINTASPWALRFVFKAPLI